jgi:hypothetical protein
MADLFQDGFDKYGPVGTGLGNTSLTALLTQGEWTSAGTNQTTGVGNYASISIVAGLSGYGTALQLGAQNDNASYTPTNAYAIRTYPSNVTTHIGGVRIELPSLPTFSNSTNAVAVAFLDAGAYQCSIVVNPSGTISFKSGSPLTGTTLATSTVALSAGVSYELEWQITFGASASYQCWLTGATTGAVSLFSGTGATETSGHSYMNQIELLAQACQTSGTTAYAQITFDDLYTRDNTGSANNAPMLNNPIVYTQAPTGDAQTQFANNGNIIGSPISVVTSTSAPGANKLFLRRFQAPVACTLNSVSTYPGATSGTANFKAVAYSDNSGAVGSLLSSGTQVTGCTSGTALTGALATPQSLTAAEYVWIGFITDTSVALWESDATLTGYSVNNTYTGGAPSSPTGFTGGLNSWVIWGNCTGAAVNYETQNQAAALGTLSYSSSSIVGNEDLYNFAALPFAVASIANVCLKGNLWNSDGGARTASLHMKSGSSDGTGSNPGVTPSTFPSWVPSFFDTDPGTGAAWTASGLNAATSGPGVAS